MAVIIQQGDQINIAFKVKSGNDYITPSNCDDMKCRIFGVTKQYSKNELTYDSGTGYWYYPISQAQTLSTDVSTLIEAQYKVNSTIKTTEPYEISINHSDIQEEWS